MNSSKCQVNIGVERNNNDIGNGSLPKHLIKMEPKQAKDRAREREKYLT